METIKLSSHQLLAVATRIDEMRKLERQVRRINELACNQELTKRQSNRRVALECRYAELAASFGIFTEHQRDPRGSALRLHDNVKDMESGTGVTL